MDTSETYIKMCNCSDIQGQAKDDRCSFWADLLMSGKYLVMCGYKLDIWLPRQDQVQEMAGLPVSAWGLFYGWVFEKDENRREPWQDFTTGEQLWLAFYMYEKHKKKWDGKKWKL